MLLLSISIFIAVYRLKNEQTTEKENENHMPEKEWKMKREKEKQIKVTHIWLNIFVEMTIWFRCYYHKRTLHIFSKWYTYIHLARVKEKKEAPKHTNYSKKLAAVTATKVNTWHWIWIHIHIIINIRRAHRFEMKNGRNCKVISRILYSKWQNTRKERERDSEQSDVVRTSNIHTHDPYRTILKLHCRVSIKIVCLFVFSFLISSLFFVCVSKYIVSGVFNVSKNVFRCLSLRFASNITDAICNGCWCAHATFCYLFTVIYILAQQFVITKQW